MNDGDLIARALEAVERDTPPYPVRRTDVEPRAETRALFQAIGQHLLAVAARFIVEGEICADHGADRQPAGCESCDDLHAADALLAALREFFPEES